MLKELELKTQQGTSKTLIIESIRYYDTDQTFNIFSQKGIS